MNDAGNMFRTDSIEHVLLVDDNPVNLQILYKTLQGSGYKLLMAEDGESAIDMANKFSPSLILLDILMPGMDGFEVCEVLKRNAQTEGIAVIFLSSLEDISAKVKGFSVGGVDYISKPFQADEVVARVSTHIKIHRLENQLASRNVVLESENQQILNATGEGVIGLDQEGRVTLINPSATAITGWSAMDSLGRRLSELGLFSVDGQALPEHRTLPYRSYRMGKATQSNMELIYRKDRVLVPVALTSTPRAEGGAVIVLRDISEWVESEEALRLAREELESQRQNIAHIERLSSTGEMAAGIAHEVNQPLTAISNYSRVAKRLLDQQPVDRQKLMALMDKLDVQSKRASEVIQRIRSYVKKPDAGLVEVNINDVLRDVIALAEVDSRINDVLIDLKAEKDLPSIKVDLVQIQQVALNLIRNAMEASTNSSQQRQNVLVKTRIAGDVIRVDVVDHGKGVADGLESRLFEPFYTTKSNGMGIGLSICRSIIQAQGGDIGFQRNPEGGSIFYFTLPAGE